MSGSTTEPTRRDWRLLAALVMLWGSAFALVKLAVASIGPAWVMAVRLLIAGAILLTILRLRGDRLPPFGPLWGWLLVIAITGNLLPYFFISWGTVHIASGMSGMLMAVMPLIVVVLAHFLLPDEPLTLTKSAGFLIGLVGVVVLLGPDRLIGLDTTGMALWGQLSVIAGAVCYALTAIIGRRMPPRPALETAAITSAIAGLIGVAGAFAFEPGGLAGATNESWLVLIVLGILPTALAALVYFALLRSAGATFLSYINYLIPVFATGVGIVFMGESFGPGTLAGLGLVLAGIAISRARWRRAVRI